MPARDEIKQVLTAEDRNYSRTMKNAGKSLEGFLNQGAKLGPSMAAAGSALSGFKGVAAGLVGAGALTALANQFIQVGERSLAMTDQLAKGAEKLGTTAQRLKEYQFAANKAGVESGVLEKSLATMQKRIAEAATGTGEAVKILKSLGLEAKQLAKLSMDEQFDAVAKAINEAETQGEKFLIAQKLMDAGGRDLVKMTDNWGEATGKTKEELLDLGYVMSEEVAQGAEDFTDSTTNLTTAWEGFGVQIGHMVDGPLTALNEKMADSIAWTTKLLDAMGAIENRRFAGNIESDIGQNNEMIAQLTRENEALDSNSEAWAQNTRQIAELRRDREQMRMRVTQLAAAEKEGAKATVEIEVALDKVTDTADKASKGYTKVGKAVKTVNDEAEDFIKSLEKQIVGLEGGKTALLEYELAALQAAGASDELVGKAQDLIDRIGEAGEKTKEAAEVAETEISDMAELGLNMLDRLDDSAQKAWYNIFSGAETSMESIKTLIFQTLAELAHQFTTKQLIIPLVAELDPSKAGAAGQALSGGGGSPLMQAGKGLFSAGKAWLGGQAIASGAAGAGASLGLGYGVSGGLAAAHAGGGAAAIGTGLTGAAAGGATAALAAIGTAMPYIGAAIAIGGALGLFGGGKETFPQFAIGGKIGDARALGKDVENIQQFADGLDDMVTQVLGASVVDAINEAAGDQQSMTHRLRHDYELQDAMRHRLALYFYHLDGAMGDALLNLPKTDTPEALAAQVQEFLVPFGEAMEALDMLTRQGIGGLEPGIATARAAARLTMESGGTFGADIQDLFSEYFSETEKLSAIYAQAYENVVDFNRELGLTGEGIIDTKDEVRAFIETLDLSTEAGQDAALTALALARNVSVLETSLAGIMAEIDSEIIALADLGQNMGDIFADTRRTLDEFGLEGAALYNHLRDEIDAIASGIGQLDTAAEIEEAMREINSLTQRALGALSEAELANLIDPLRQYLDDLEAYGRERVAELEAVAQEEKEALSTVLAESANRMLDAADQGSTAANINMQAALALQRAVDSMPRNITVTVRDSGELGG